MADIADYLSECCSTDVEMEGEGPLAHVRCSSCRKTCTLKPRTLGISVFDEIRAVDKGPGQL